MSVFVNCHSSTGFLIDCFRYINFNQHGDCSVNDCYSHKFYSAWRFNGNVENKCYSRRKRNAKEIFCMPFLGAISYANNCLGNGHYYNV